MSLWPRKRTKFTLWIVHLHFTSECWKIFKIKEWFWDSSVEVETFRFYAMIKGFFQFFTSIKLSSLMLEKYFIIKGFLRLKNSFVHESWKDFSVCILHMWTNNLMLSENIFEALKKRWKISKETFWNVVFHHGIFQSFSKDIFNDVSWFGGKLWKKFTWKLNKKLWGIK